MSHNKHKMIGSCQQGRVLIAVKDEVVKLISESSIDLSGLGYWKNKQQLYNSS